MSEIRTAASVGRLLRKHGIKTGYRYSQTGYYDSKGLPFSEPGVMVSRMIHSRYDGVIEDDAVTVYPICDRDGQHVTSEMLTKVIEALNAEGLPVIKKGANFRIPDEPEFGNFSDGVLLHEFERLSYALGANAALQEEKQVKRDQIKAEILKRMGA